MGENTLATWWLQHCSSPGVEPVPNLWPVGQKWPARPLEVALDLSTKKNKIYMKN